MENVTKYIQLTLYVILFLVGMYLMLNHSVKYSNIISNVRDRFKDKEKVLYEQQILEENYVSYKELIAKLLNNLEYDIEIDGLLINKKEHNALKIESYGIEKADYIKTYIYDKSGNIIKIVYSKKE